MANDFSVCGIFSVVNSRVAEEVAVRIVASDTVRENIYGLESDFQLDVSEMERIVFNAYDSVFAGAKQEKEGNTNHIGHGKHGIVCGVVGKPLCHMLHNRKRERADSLLRTQCTGGTGKNRDCQQGLDLDLGTPLPQTSGQWNILHLPLFKPILVSDLD
jgi:hypothetical protein